MRENGQIQLTTALNALARREHYLAIETRGSRFNLGIKFGVVEAQIALAMAGVDRERILALLVETLTRTRAEREPLRLPPRSGRLTILAPCESPPWLHLARF